MEKRKKREATCYISTDKSAGNCRVRIILYYTRRVYIKFRLPNFVRPLLLLLALFHLHLIYPF
jgi:hypothetical protein